MIRAATITVIALLVIAIARLGTSADDTHTATVQRVIDGDTLITTNGATVRLIGFDAPEAGECGGREATRALAELVDGETVTLTPGPEPRDDYGRALRHVSVDAEMASVAMVRRGWGETLTIPPNDVHAGAIAEAEAKARRAGRGMWGEPCTTS